MLLTSASFAQSNTSEPLRGFTAAHAAAERHEEQVARAVPDPARIGKYIQFMSAKPHMAGTAASREVAEYALGLLNGWGLDAHIEAFEALLPTPRVRVLELIEPRYFRAALNEPPLADDTTSGNVGEVPAFNAYSGSGDVTAPLVYVNYGVPADYDYLAKQGIDVKGKIVIARYGGSWRGVKPKVAWEHGALACLIYSDPRDDGYFQGDAYPVGPWRPAEGVQRGSVMDMALYPGDPLSPGFASEPGVHRLPLAEAGTLMKIPVMPISSGDALPLLSALNGPVAPEEWRGALGITYHIGPGVARVHFHYEADNSSHPLYDVIVRIPGNEFPDEWVLLGNHHDAWVHGASDPLSGAAPLLETARSLSELLKTGWKPKRTILMALWDGEEFGLVGSTEWCEKHAAELDKSLVAYVNSDSNGKGALTAGGSHTLERFMSEVARDVTDPITGKSLAETARNLPKRAKKAGLDAATGNEFHLAPLGSGSDYTAFLQHLGIASLNLGFSDEVGFGGIYHSVYDSYDWYRRFGDPNFAYGKALSQVTTTVLLRIADADILPLEFSRLAANIETYLDEIEKSGGEKLKASPDRPNFAELRAQIGALRLNAADYEHGLHQHLELVSSATPERLAGLNRHLLLIERSMKLSDGLPGRPWFQHGIYAPGLYTGYDVKTLPGVREAIEAERYHEATSETGHLVEVMKHLNQAVKESTDLMNGL